MPDMYGLRQRIKARRSGTPRGPQGGHPILPPLKCLHMPQAFRRFESKGFPMSEDQTFYALVALVVLAIFVVARFPAILLAFA